MVGPLRRCRGGARAPALSLRDAAGSLPPSLKEKPVALVLFSRCRGINSPNSYLRFCFSTRPCTPSSSPSFFRGKGRGKGEGRACMQTIWLCSSVVRASALHAECRVFNPRHNHTSKLFFASQAFDAPPSHSLARPVHTVSIPSPPISYPPCMLDAAPTNTSAAFSACALGSGA